MVFKLLTKQVKQLDIILGNILEVNKNIQRDCLRAKGLSDETTKQKADEILGISSRLKQEILEQVEALKILQRTPPGFGTAILDFMTTMFSDKPGTRRKEYFEKLRKIDKNINWTHDPIAELMNISSAKIDSKTLANLKSAVFNYIKRQDENSFETYKNIAKQIEPQVLYETLMGYKREFLKKYDKQSVEKLFNTFLSTEELIAWLKTQKKTAGLFSKKVTKEEIITNFDKYYKQLDYFEELMTRMKSEVNNIFQNISSKASEKDVEIIQKYNNFFGILLSKKGAIIGKVLEISQLLKEVVKSLQLFEEQSIIEEPPEKTANVKLFTKLIK